MKFHWLLVAVIAATAPARADVGYDDPFKGYADNQSPCLDCTEATNANCQKFAQEASNLALAANNDRAFSTGHCLPLGTFQKAFNGSIPNSKSGSFINADFAYKWCMSHSVGQGRAQLQAEADFINKCHAALMRRVTTPAGAMPRVDQSKSGGKSGMDQGRALSSGGLLENNNTGGPNGPAATGAPVGTSTPGGGLQGNTYSSPVR